MFGADLASRSLCVTSTASWIMVVPKHPCCRKISFLTKSHCGTTAGLFLSMVVCSPLSPTKKLDGYCGMGTGSPG